jgi:crotonobetaine/carnitine-CoA ligase
VDDAAVSSDGDVRAQAGRSVAEGVFLPTHRRVRTTPVGLLLKALKRNPERDLLRAPGKAPMRVREFHDRVARWAAVLAREGIVPGDRVASFCTNSVEFLALQYGTYGAGAVEVPINAEQRGPILAGILGDSDPTLVVVDAELGEIVSEQLPEGARMLVLDDELTARVDAAEPADLYEGDVTELGLILYTSGTTGPSKGVMLARGYLPSVASNWQAVMQLGAGDASYFCLPFFHIDAHVMGALALLSDSVFGVAKRFSVSRFWDESAELGATWFLLVGSTLSALAARRPLQAPEHTFRFGLGAPIMADAYGYFEDELGIPMLQIYGQTEADHVTFTTLKRNRRGSAGWACCGFDVRLVDESDEPVPIGDMGRVVYRPREPLMMTHGYWRNPEATAEASRNLWWHTGDLGRLDGDGFLWFLGRLSDSLRRRGENISAWELETTVNGAPGVGGSAAMAVRDELGGEDEVKVFVILKPEAQWDAQEFFAYCESNLPRYAVPRFVQLMTEEQVVRGPGSGAIQKHLLPTGNDAETIDRMALVGGACDG